VLCFQALAPEAGADPAATEIAVFIIIAIYNFSLDRLKKL
jgi:hypothetical protein